MSMGATPGPWTYDYSPNHSGMHPSFMILGPNVTVIADVSRDPERGVIGAQVEANARLIAAAPELLNLVKRFRQWDDLPGRGDGPFWMQEADNVLARAEGRLP